MQCRQLIYISLVRCIFLLYFIMYSLFDFCTIVFFLFLSFDFLFVCILFSIAFLSSSTCFHADVHFAISVVTIFCIYHFVFTTFINDNHASMKFVLSSYYYELDSYLIWQENHPHKARTNQDILIAHSLLGQL